MFKMLDSIAENNLPVDDWTTYENLRSCSGIKLWYYLSPFSRPVLLYRQIPEFVASRSTKKCSSTKHLLQNILDSALKLVGSR